MVGQKLACVTATLAFLAARVDAQAIFNEQTEAFDCPVANGRYCAQDSLTGNWIIRCTGSIGKLADCRDLLFGDPETERVFRAPCYQLDASAGNAECSFHQIVFPENGKPFRIANVTEAATSLAAQKVSSSVPTTGFPESAKIPSALESPTSIAQVKPTNNVDLGQHTRASIARPVPQLTYEEITTPLPKPTGPEVHIPRATLEAEAPDFFNPDINGPGQALRECNNTTDILPEFALEGICNPPGVKPRLIVDGTGNPSNAKRDLAINDAKNASTTNATTPSVPQHTGGANMYRVEMAAVGAGVLALASFMLGN